MKKKFLTILTGIILIGIVCIWTLTHTPEYTLFGVSTNEYTARPSQINETLTTESEQDLPVCSFDSVLLYDEKTDKFYNVNFEAKGQPVIPHFTEAKELAYELELPNVGHVRKYKANHNERGNRHTRSC